MFNEACDVKLKSNLFLFGGKTVNGEARSGTVNNVQHHTSSLSSVGVW